MHFKNFHSPSKKQGNKTSYFCSLLFAVREVSSPLDQLLLFLHFPPNTGEMGCCMCSTVGDSAYGSRQRELGGGVKREDMLPLTPQWELLFGMVSFSALMDWQQCMLQSLSLIFPAQRRRVFPLQQPQCLFVISYACPKPPFP